MNKSKQAGGVKLKWIDYSYGNLYAGGTQKIISTHILSRSVVGKIECVGFVQEASARGQKSKVGTLFWVHV
jgi:hypothetical protein